MVIRRGSRNHVSRPVSGSIQGTALVRDDTAVQGCGVGKRVDRLVVARSFGMQQGGGQVPGKRFRDRPRLLGHLHVLGFPAREYPAAEDRRDRLEVCALLDAIRIHTAEHTW